jgi:phage portal protein BeeE
VSILSKALGGARAQTNFVGAPSFRHVNPYNLYNHYKSDDYASAYPNIRSIVNELVTITPHAIDANGKPVSHPALDALHHPNQKDSYVMFMEKLGTSVLALPYTYLLVWRRENGEARPGGPYGGRGVNVAGYTFLENPAISYVDGKVYYSIGSQTFTENDVIAIPGGADPRNLYGGYSPTMAAARWSTLDSYIADFQKGFFENNAIPAGVFKVAAPTVQEYDDMVEMLKSRHQGAGNNNNVTYTHVPLDESGNQAPSQIEWIPFAQTNKEIDFKPLLEHVDNRLSEAYGVSNIIKGVDSNATYNNAEVSEAGFAKRAVRPLALRIFSQMTHELNRITGGLGVALTFTYDIPAISDALKVKAETKNIEANMIRLMRADGYSLDTIVDAFGLSPAYKLLREDETTPVINNDKPEVDEGGEVDSSPDPDKIDGVTPINVKKSPRAELTDEQRLHNAAKDFMRVQIEGAIREIDETASALYEPTSDELDAFVVAMMAVIVGILLANGQSEYAAGAAVAGIALSELQGFTVPEDAEDAYRAYLQRVGTTYSNETAERIREVLAASESEGLNRRETTERLRNILDTDEWRIDRLARTELNNSQNIGKLEGMKELAAEVGGTWEKTIDHSGVTPCPLCASQEGIWKPLDTPLWGLGESIEAVNDKGETIIYVNDWQSDEANDYHPNGKGTLVFRRVD